MQGVGVVTGATPGGLGCVSTETEGAGPLLWPSVTPGPLEELLLKAELMALPTCIIAWRAGGTADRTTPMANTARPTANAGRSIASRQSLGRCRSRGRGACRAWPGRRRPTRLAAKPEMASQTPRAPLGRRAWAGRDRILSRIRSRPSAPGSTWSAAAWSSRRKNSAKSCPRPPSEPRPDLTMTPVPVPRAARPFRARYDS